MWYLFFKLYLSSRTQSTANNLTFHLTYSFVYSLRGKMPFPVFFNLPMLDFSFCDLKDVKDLLKTPARQGKVRVIPHEANSHQDQGQGQGGGNPGGLPESGPPSGTKAGNANKDLSENEEDEEDTGQSLAIAGVEDDTAATPAKGKKKKQDGSDETDDEETLVVQYYTSNVKLSNNLLADCSHLISQLKTVVVEACQKITILDLSFNQIPAVPNEITELVNLHVVYLHANAIKEIDEVNKLKPLKFLYAISLNGNPIENRKNYRFHVLWLLPKLKTLDFTSFSKRDRETVKVYEKFFKPGQAAQPKSHVSDYR